MSLPRTTDFLIAGGGVIGLTIALEIKSRFPDCSVLLIEKEDVAGLHASGRNSGVLHAGFYYSADSLKARLTRQGNLEMSEYCLSRKLRINRCGKLVVTRNEREVSVLHELVARANTNNVEVKLISAEDAREIEPRVKTFSQALYSPSTSSIDPREVMQSLSSDAEDAGITLMMGTCYQSASGKTYQTNKAKIEAGYFINACGLYADKIAKQFGFSKDFTILPFKGLYLYSLESAGALKTHVYPVPDINRPFLGVHFTLDVNKRIKIGPTAIPVLWRENYSGLTGFNFREFVEIINTNFNLAIHGQTGLRELAVKELQKIHRPTLVNLASEMLQGIVPENYKQWAKPGIRAQLLDTRSMQLLMDFCYEGDEKSFHVLNAVSPAFTCAFPFARLMCEKIEQFIK